MEYKENRPKDEIARNNIFSGNPKEESYREEETDEDSE